MRKKNSMDDLKKINDRLEFYIRPQSFPLGIKMMRKGDVLPEKTKLPSRDFNLRIAICQGMAMSRRYGWAVSMAKEEINCPVTKVVFGFEKEGENYKKGKACCGMYTETEEAGARTESMVPKFNYREYASVLSFPLSRGEVKPDLVLIYGNSAQVMRLLTGALYKSGGYLFSGFSGRIDCADIVIQTMKSKKCQVILPCYGDRIFAQTEDYEMAFTIPYDRIYEVIEGLEETQRGGIRYPVPSFLRYEGHFPEKYRIIEEDWKE